MPKKHPSLGRCTGCKIILVEIGRTAICRLPVAHGVPAALDACNCKVREMLASVNTEMCVKKDQTPVTSAPSMESWNIPLIVDKATRRGSSLGGHGYPAYNWCHTQVLLLGCHWNSSITAEVNNSWNLKYEKWNIFLSLLSRYFFDLGNFTANNNCKMFVCWFLYKTGWAFAKLIGKDFSTLIFPH